MVAWNGDGKTEYNNIKVQYRHIDMLSTIRGRVPILTVVIKRRSEASFGAVSDCSLLCDGFKEAAPRAASTLSQQTPLLEMSQGGS